jgi:hypothetical protein
MSYASWKKSVIGKQLNVDGAYGSQCVDLIMAYAEHLFPGHNWPELIGRGNAKDLFGAANPQYFTKIKNDHSKVSQLPRQGDILVFGATPQQGFTNKYHNPYGHIGIADSRINGSGFNLLQLNAPLSSSPVNVHYYSWRYRPCIGWLRPIAQSKPAPKPQPPKKEKNMPTLTTEADLDFLYETDLGRKRHGNEGADVYLNKDYRFVDRDLWNSDEAKKRRAAESEQLEKLQNQFDSLSKKLGGQNSTILSLHAQVASLRDQLADADDDNGDAARGLKNAEADAEQAQKVITDLRQTISRQKAQLAACGSDDRPTVQAALKVLFQAIKRWIRK